MRKKSTFLVLLLIFGAGCTSFGLGNQTAGTIETQSVESTPQGITPTSYSALDSEPIREAVQRAAEQQPENGSIIVVEYTRSQKEAVFEDIRPIETPDQNYMYIKYQNQIIRMQVTEYTS